MKVIHTDIYGHLTEFLVDEARDHIIAGKKIFYIVPSSLSFEKEKENIESSKIRIINLFIKTSLSFICRFIIIQKVKK